MANRKFYDLIIIGGGPAGLSAGIYALRASMRTVLIEKGAPGGQVALSAEVENYPAIKNKSGVELAQNFLEHAQDYNLEVLAQEVTALEPGLDFHAVRLDAGEEDNYGKGVSYCAVCDGFFFRNKTVAVVGGGDTAAEEALYLAKITKKVYLVHRRNILRASMILQKRLDTDPKVEILWNTQVKAIRAEGGEVCAMELEDTYSGETRDLKIDGAFIFIGFEPNNQLVPAGTRMNADGYVVTDEKCETNIDGIFAIGDLREKYARQIVISAADGCTAALASAHYVEIKRAAGT